MSFINGGGGGEEEEEAGKPGLCGAPARMSSEFSFCSTLTDALMKGCFNYEAETWSQLAEIKSFNFNYL